MIYLDQNSDGIQSGNFPANDQELLLGPGAAEHYQIQTSQTDPVPSDHREHQRALPLISERLQSGRKT